ncbi:MAG: protease [Massilia sp.]|nr:protease [Massilia sp.]
MQQLLRKHAGRAICCIALALAAGGAVKAAKPTERSKQKAAAEANRAAIQQKLSTLKRDISRTESEKETAADTLAESEEAISGANRALRELAAEQDGTNAKLRELGATGEQLGATIEAQKKQLGKLLREQYIAGNEDRIKLLLSGDNPNRINRDLQLMAYVSQAQARLLASLRGNLTAVETNHEQAQNAKDELEEIAAEQLQQKALLEQEKATHAALLGSLSNRLAAQRKEAGGLARDEQRMSGLVDQLSRLIREQAAAAAAEQRRLAAVAAAKARAQAEAQALARAQAEARALAQARQKAERVERERLARLTPRPGAKPAAPFKPDPIDADEPKVAATPPAPRPTVAPPRIAAPEPGAARAADIALAPAVPDGAFASLRGQLRAPVSGTLAARFGAKRGEARWKGVFIKAAEGADVRAVAGGRVVFANWMRGFGNLVIVDHGSQYLSIYGNNQALLKHVGDAVKAGDTIASAGSTGGNEESGLYFELRHLGQAFDPASWIKF